MKVKSRKILIIIAMVGFVILVATFYILFHPSDAASVNDSITQRDPNLELKLVHVVSEII
jgi:hypothetical protein